jgi:hypothetical protein
MGRVVKAGRWTFQPSGLAFDGNVTFAQWQRLGGTLRDMRDHVFWWLGDWWLYGERVYGEMASQEAKDEVELETGYSYETVRQAAWVCEKFEFDHRITNCSYRHHRAVAAVEDPKMRASLLKRAAREQLTVAQVATEALAYKRPSAVGLESFYVTVKCPTANAQAELVDRLQAEGLRCEVVTKRERKKRNAA